jgi:hypothetical protein
MYSAPPTLNPVILCKIVATVISPFQVQSFSSYWNTAICATGLSANQARLRQILRLRLGCTTGTTISERFDLAARRVGIGNLTDLSGISDATPAPNRVQNQGCASENFHAG